MKSFPPKARSSFSFSPAAVALACLPIFHANIYSSDCYDFPLLFRFSPAAAVAVLLPFLLYLVLFLGCGMLGCFGSVADSDTVGLVGHYAVLQAVHRKKSG